MVDISPLTGFLFEIFKVTLMGGLSVLVPFAVKWILDKTKLDELLGEETVRKNLYGILENAVVFGMDALEEKYKGLPKTIEVKNDVLSVAAKYVIQSAPDALAKFKIDPYTAEGQARLQAMLAIRLAKQLGVTADPTTVDGNFSRQPTNSIIG